ncbi:hypothetical protein L6164_022612 [Bauhinia variegata]|uniref:Uncharacterized protein n=1 Tax=Bauhinia variegata TaxID=167791 RepID=A0ACB9MH82_BAUVA|nr:hypothetical protein L6164_022612 [Bauhinia variegata]
MAAWHFFRQLTFTLGARSPALSRRFLRSSPCPINRWFSAPFSSSYKARDSWPPQFSAPKFSTASSAEIPVDDSFTSPYLAVLIHCPKDVADVLAEALLCFGASSASMDEDDAHDNTNEICISSIFAEDEDINMCVSLAADSIGLKKIPRFEVKIGEHEWMKKVEESFHPTEITKDLWVVPKWRTPPDVHATNIILNPGLAFGTGEHATTKLCLLLLHSHIEGGECILDYGTGSVILAIAALKFGAAHAVGIDVDSQAISSASQNAALNNIGPEKMQLHLISTKTSHASMNDSKHGVIEEENTSEMRKVIDKDKYDVVIANIFLNPLLELADRIIYCAKPGALIGLSGIIIEQIPNIMERYSPFLEGIVVSEMEDWACVSGRKRRDLDQC